MHKAGVISLVSINVVVKILETILEFLHNLIRNITQKSIF